MSHIIYRKHPDGPPAMQLIIGGIDYSDEVFKGVELVEVGEGAHAEVGLQVTFVVSRLDLGDEADVQVTDRLPDVADRLTALRVRSS